MKKKVIFEADNSRKEETVSTWAVAEELGISLPVFYMIFYPRKAHIFGLISKSLPSDIIIPTWCKGLRLYQSRNAGYSSYWRNHVIPYDSYKEILRRWNLLTSRQMVSIRRGDDYIKERFGGTMDRQLSDERRTRLSPYVGMELQLYGELGDVRKVYKYGSDGSVIDSRYKLIITNIRFNKDRSDPNIYANHITIPYYGDLKDLINMNMERDDTLFFTARVYKYKDYSNGDRYGLSNLKIHNVFREEDAMGGGVNHKQ